MNQEQARFNMIQQQIRPWDVTHADVLDWLSQVKREAFVPQAYQAWAFMDIEIPLGHGQFMLAPRVEARLLQDSRVKAGDKVLEIGTGSGFMAALLAQCAKQVLSLEINPDLAQQAQANLQHANITPVQVRQADGANGAAADAPFDLIVLSGSVAEVPHTLLAQLQIGGRLIGIVGDEPVMTATLISRHGPSQFTTTALWETVAPRLLHFPEPSPFHF
jgi:protein-L-isoaspartate(D-aspartate) O-methyltransferase